MLQPGDSGLWSSLGGLYLANGDTAQAGRAFDMSLSIEPNAGALTNLGAMRFDAGDYAQAAEMFQRAATLQPDDYLHWGNLRRCAGRVSQHRGGAHWHRIGARPSWRRPISK